MSSATPIEKLFFAIDHVRSTHRLTALISVSCLIVLIGAKVIKPKLAKRLPAVTYIPEILIVVVIVTGRSLLKKSTPAGIPMTCSSQARTC